MALLPPGSVADAVTPSPTINITPLPTGFDIPGGPLSGPPGGGGGGWPGGPLVVVILADLLAADPLADLVADLLADFLALLAIPMLVKTVSPCADNADDTRRLDNINAIIAIRFNLHFLLHTLVVHR